MIELKELKAAIEAKGQAVAELREATDKYHDEVKAHGAAMAETKAELKKVNGILNDSIEAKEAVEKRISELEIASKRSGGNNGGDNSDEHAAEYKTKFFDYMRKARTERTETMDAASQKFIDENPEFKAMSVNSQADGGYLVPKDTSGRMVTAIRETSPLRNLASVQSISTDALDGTVDTDEAEGGWTEEVASRAETNNPKVGVWKIPVHEMYAKPKATMKLIEDSAVDIESWLVQKGAKRFARLENKVFIDGTGVGKCTGIMTKTIIYTDPDVAPKDSVRTVKSGANAVMTDPDFLKKMVYRLKGVYRGNANWLLSREGQEAVRLMKQDGKYVWQAGLQAGQPDRLLNYGIGEMNDMADFAEDSLSVAFGNIAEAYQIVDRLQFSLLVDPYSSKPFVEYYMRRRVGADVINSDALIYGELSS